MSAGFGPAAAPRPTILAIEDEPRNGALLQAILKPGRFDLYVTGTLTDGRAWLATNTPQLILLDRHLPDGDGLDLVGELRAAPNGKAMRIVLVTASVLPTDRESAALARVDAFVAKPIRIQELLQEIERQLAR
jgi:CheY-like chemotaxis protein